MSVLETAMKMRKTIAPTAPELSPIHLRSAPSSLARYSHMPTSEQEHPNIVAATKSPPRAAGSMSIVPENSW